MQELFQLLAEYNAQTNREMYQILEGLPSEKLTEDLGSFYKSIIGLLNHHLTSDISYMRRLGEHFPEVAEAQPPLPDTEFDWSKPITWETLPDLESVRWDVDAFMKDVCARMPEEKYADVLHYSTPWAGEQVKVAWLMFLHVFNHETHHRGGVAVLLDQLQVENDYSNIMRLPSPVPEDLPTPNGSLKEIFQLIAEYNSQANHAMFDILDQVPPEKVAEDVGSFYKSILGIANHVLMADLTWLRRLAPHFPEFAEVQPPLPDVEFERGTDIVWPTLPELEAVRWDVDAFLKDAFGLIPAEDFSKTIQYTSSRGEPRENIAWYSFLQFLNHETHHRGSIAVLSDQMQVENDYSSIIRLQVPPLE
ncbi:MAG TPA: DinB family protein [Candidatus Lokiarchaeia archaeon]|nr:DinB family protein [Candidatus Lokiarchaeia archaeon]